MEDPHAEKVPLTVDCCILALKSNSLQLVFFKVSAKPPEYSSPIELAKTVADHLRSRFGATRVLLFGSLARGYSSSGFSDIDIYFEGVPRAKVDEVTGRLMCHFSAYDIDFWPDAHCEATFRDEVLRTAIAL